MSNNLYDILGKFYAANPAGTTAEPAKTAEPATPGKLMEGIDKRSLTSRLNERFLAEKDLGKHNNATTGFAALAKKTGGGEKGARIAGAQLAKMRKSGAIKEAYIYNSNDAIKLLANLRAIAKQAEIGGELPRGFAGQVVNDLYDVITWIESKLSESVSEGSDYSQDPANKGEYDREGDMADSDLRTAEEAARELQSILDADDNIPEWVQAKITKAVDYLDTSRDYMKSNPPEHEHEEGARCDSCDEPMEQCSCHINEAKKAKPDFLDVDKDGNKKEPFKKAVKDKKVKEDIDIATFFEDTMKEINDVFVMEKAVSKQQQKFMGMVHAMQTGEKIKNASTGLKKVAHDMSKKDAKDFASTKHKGLPKKVSEGQEMLSEGKLDAIVHRYGKEVREFSQGNDLDDNLYHALYDYYFDDMPYGVKKARDGDPYAWVADRFDDAIKNGEIEVAESKLDTAAHAAHIHNDLDELAKLAGMHRPHAVAEASCNMTMEGDHCPVHGMAECWSGVAGGMSMPMESAKPDYIDIDKDGDKEEPMKKAVKDKEEVEEAAKPDFLDVDKDGNKKEPFKKAVKDKEVDESFDDMLRLAGMPGRPAAEPVAEEFDNEPDEEYVDVDTIIKQGEDLNRSKKQDPATANKAANPVGEDVLKLESKLERMYNSIKVKG